MIDSTQVPTEGVQDAAASVLYDVDRLRGIQLAMVLEVKRICDKYDLPVFLAYGSLLGAVRHQGFIPWDDDIDLAMLRDDYESFCRVCERELGSRWSLQTLESEPALGQLFAKVRARGTSFVPRDSARVQMDQGIYIDVFPLDNAPNGKLSRRMHAGIHYVVRRELVRRCGYGLSPRGERWARVIRVPMLLVPTRAVTRLLTWNATRYNGASTNSIVSLAGGYSYHRETLRREWFSERLLLDFEGLKYWAPSGFREVLTQLYGDYRTPPPTSERQSHHDPIVVEFGDVE